MIPIHELRVGSLISFDDYSMEAFEVEDMQHDGQGFFILAKGGKNGEWTNPIDLVTGIPITVETMEVIAVTGVENIGHITFKENGDPEFYVFGKRYYHIKFIHQLQNFYLGVTGQEMPLGEFAREKLSKILAR